MLPNPGSIFCLQPFEGLTVKNEGYMKNSIERGVYRNVVRFYGSYHKGKMCLFCVANLMKV